MRSPTYRKDVKCHMDVQVYSLNVNYRMSVSFSDYKSRGASILNESMKYNGRVNTLELNENPDARFKMYEKMAVKNKATEYREALSNDFENSSLSQAFFSAENVQIIQNGLRAGVYKMSAEKQLIVSPQNVDILKTIMRHMFIQYAQFLPDKVSQQIERLNMAVWEYAVPSVYAEAMGYLKYLQDTSSLVVPIDLPKQVDRCFKTIQQTPWM